MVSKGKTVATNYQAALRMIVWRRMERAVLTTPGLATAAGMRPDYLGHCLGGRRPLSVPTLNLIAPILGTTTEMLHREALAICE